MNAVLGLMGGGMKELELGLSGALNISDAMDALIGFLFVNSVPPNWLKICGQIGPTGNYNRKNLADWYVNLKERFKQLDDWAKVGAAERARARGGGEAAAAPSRARPSPTRPPARAARAQDPYTRPSSVWIAGLFNPMGYVTACLQMTARAKALPLDSMMISTEVMPFLGEQAEAQPDEGTFVHGLFMEGAKWSTEANTVYESDPKVTGRARDTRRGRRPRARARPPNCATNPSPPSTPPSRRARAGPAPGDAGDQDPRADRGGAQRAQGVVGRRDV